MMRPREGQRHDCCGRTEGAGARPVSPRLGPSGRSYRGWGMLLWLAGPVIVTSWTVPHRPYSAGKAATYDRKRGVAVCGINGWGRVGDRYSWKENEFEMEVEVPVPPDTKKDHVLFKASTVTIKLGLVNSTELLLGGKLKGRIALDGSYWSLEGEEGSERAIKLLLEKKQGALENSWDWRRVLEDEPATEVDYQPLQPFDTKKYVHQMLGPEGINMSLVDKQLFGSGGVMPNVTKETLLDYVDARVLTDKTGLMQEVQDADAAVQKKPVEVVARDGVGADESEPTVPRDGASRGAKESSDGHPGVEQGEKKGSKIDGNEESEGDGEKRPFWSSWSQDGGS